MEARGHDVPGMSLSGYRPARLIWQGVPYIISLHSNLTISNENEDNDDEKDGAPFTDPFYCSLNSSGGLHQQSVKGGPGCPGVLEVKQLRRPLCLSLLKSEDSTPQRFLPVPGRQRGLPCSFVLQNY